MTPEELPPAARRQFESLVAIHYTPEAAMLHPWVTDAIDEQQIQWTAEENRIGALMRDGYTRLEAVRMLAEVAQATLTMIGPTTEAPGGLAERLKQARQAQCLLPAWLQNEGVPLMHAYGQWNLLFHLPVTITEVITRGRKYTVPANKLKPAWVLFALPIDQLGRFLISALRIVSPVSIELPHVHAGSACLGLGDGPKAVTNLEDYIKLGEALRRALGQINLDSLLTNDKRKWPKEISRALPRGTRANRPRRKIFQAAITKYFTEQEGETWTAIT